MAETKKKKAQAAADSPASISESSSPEIETAAAESAGETADSDRRSSQDAIALRAYEIYLERGSAGGSAEDDWIQAERELGGATGGEDDVI